MAFSRRRAHKGVDRATAAGRAAFVLAFAGSVTGCGGDDVTGVGRELVAGGVVRTVEIVLDAADFLEADSTLGGFTSPSVAGNRLVALDVGAGLAARSAHQFAAAPFTVDIQTDSVTVVQDTLATFVGARLSIVVDSLSLAPGDSALLVLAALQEEWDPQTATWDNALDSAFATAPWTAPGGGALQDLDSSLWVAGGDTIAGGDTVSFFVDSATAAAWTDTGDPSRGALIRTDADGALLEVRGAILWLMARPSVGPDTILEVPVSTTGQTTLIVTPPPPPDVLLVGGAPGNRAFFRFAPGLDTLAVPCPEAGVECSLTVADADLTFAGLEVTPVAVSGIPPIVRTTTLAGRSVNPDPQFPLVRAPLGASTGSVDVSAAAMGGVADSTIVVDATRFLNTLIEGDDAPDRLAVVSQTEGLRFGTVAIRGIGPTQAPRLRLVLTVATPQEIR